MKYVYKCKGCGSLVPKGNECSLCESLEEIQQERNARCLKCLIERKLQGLDPLFPCPTWSILQLGLLRSGVEW